MSALDNLIYGLQNFRLFIQDDVELYSGSIKVSLQIEAAHELEKLRKDLELSQQHLKECDSELSYECHQGMKLHTENKRLEADILTVRSSLIVRTSKLIDAEAELKEARKVIDAFAHKGTIAAYELYDNFYAVYIAPHPAKETA